MNADKYAVPIEYENGPRSALFEEQGSQMLASALLHDVPVDPSKHFGTCCSVM